MPEETNGREEETAPPQEDLQREHNQAILTRLNTDDIKMLKALPAIRPKTGLIILGYRKLYGRINSIQVKID